MREFATDREALDFLSAKIVAEAARQNMPLSEVERKMLYFSETDWTLPDMAEVSAEFEQRYDDDEYERKISSLIEKIESRGNTGKWDAAIEKLSDGDHYLQVMLDPANSAEGGVARPPHDLLKLWLTAFGIVFGLIAVGLLGNWLFGPRFGSVVGGFLEDRDGFGVVVLLAVFIWFFGPKVKDYFSAFLNRK